MLIQAYNPQWPQWFERIQAILAAALQGLDHTIEHVGSTAVPGLAAKPIIDIDIVYPPTTDFKTIQKRLQDIGYYHNGNQGIADREVFKRQASIAHAILDSIAHHLYVCPQYSHELKRHIKFRDCLRKDETARLWYQTIKYQLAEETQQDRKRYAALKQLKANPFINQLIGMDERQ